MEEQRMHLVISGRVQGVGFRYFTYMAGTNLHLSGWVRNRADGNVEVLAEGSRDKLNTFIRVVRSGPEMAVVIDVDIEWSRAKGDLPPFTILATA